MRILKILLVVTSITISCQEKKDNLNKSNSSNIIKSDNIMIEEILVKQLKQGYKQIYIDPGLNVQTDKFTEQEFEVVVLISENILQSHGFKTLSKDVFSQKIKDVFGRIIDNTSKNRYLYINLYNKCNREMSFYPNDGIDYNGTYIIKDKGFVTNFYYIPEITDYQKDYTDASKLEDTYKSTFKNTNNEHIKISFWKDFPNLKETRKKNVQTLVARNMYLFNDNKAQYKWLILNDQYFMESLVKTFGYSEDKELLQWLLLKTLPKNYSNYNKNIEKEFEKLLWTKNCDGSISIHENTLEVLKNLSTPDNSDFILCLADYIQHGLCLGCDIEQREDLTFQQKSKIAAYLLGFGEQYKYNPQYDFNQMFLGNFYNYDDYNKNYIKEFEKNKFYGLKNLKNWYEKASVEENIFKNNDLPDNPQPIDYYYKSRK